MQFTPDGNRLVTVSRETSIATVQIWNVATGKKESSFTVPTSQAGEPLVSPDGEMIAFATMTSNISLRDLRTGLEPFGRSGFESAPVALAFASGGQLVAADDSSICCWNYSSGERLHQILAAARPNSRPDSVVGLLVPPDGKSVIVRFKTTTAQYDLKTGDLNGMYLPPPSLAVLNETMALSPGGQSLNALSRSNDGSRLCLVQWNIATRKSSIGWNLSVVADFQNELFSNELNYKIAGPYVAELKPGLANAVRWNQVEIAQLTPTIDLRDLATGRVILTVTPSSAANLIACSRTVLVAVSRSESAQQDGRGLTLTTSTVVESWEIMTGEKLAKWSIPSITDFALSPNGRTIALAHGRKIEIRDLTGDGEPTTRFAESDTNCLTFSPDGRLLASGHGNGTVLIWDVNEALRFKPGGQALTASQREVCWTELSRDSKAAIRASNRLVADPAGTVALLRDRLKPIEPIDLNRFKRLLAKLDSQQFAERETASQELAALGERARPNLQAAMRTTPSTEVRRRLGLVLTDSVVVRAPSRWRQFRAIAILERIASPDATAILSDLSKGDPAANETKEAIDSLHRLSESHPSIDR